MTTKDTYKTVLENATNIALATETLEGHTPDVRTVNFLYLPDESENTVFVATSQDANKVKQLDANHNVSFTTSPLDAGTVRVTGAVAKLDNDRKPAIFDDMDKKYASFKMFDDAARANMNVYAISYNEAEVFSRGTEHLHF